MPCCAQRFRPICCSAWPSRGMLYAPFFRLVNDRKMPSNGRLAPSASGIEQKGARFDATYGENPLTC